MTIMKRGDTRIGEIALSGKSASEEVMDLSQERLRNE
jgi:hypothetical protein